jgi:phosphohistidine phosphatase
MQLYLVQHGHALDKEQDPERPLSDRGRRDVEAVAGFVGRLDCQARDIWHSGKARARQTAELLQPALAPEGTLAESPGLAPRDEPRPLAQQLANRSVDLALVGHLPHLTRLASILLADHEEEEVIGFQQGAVVALARDDQHVWRVQWMVTPEMVAQ